MKKYKFVYKSQFHVLISNQDFTKQFYQWSLWLPIEPFDKINFKEQKLNEKE